MNKTISFIIPVYNEEDSLFPLYQGIIKNAKEYSYEILFINDGSTDNSEGTIKELIKQDSNVKLISFRKNFGKSLALQTGFRNVTGDLIITMDADLQDEPSEIPRFIEKIEEGYDLVSGWKYNRLDPLEKTAPSKLFNKVVSTVSGVKLHDFNCGFKAYRREVTDSLDIYGELHRFIPVLASRYGFKIAEIPVQHNKREFGKSKYGVERYFRGLFDAISVTFILKYYDSPMYFFGRLGLVSFIIGFILCFGLTIQKFMGQTIGGRPLLLLGILMIILGVQFISIGLIGDMLVDLNIRKRYNENHVKDKYNYDNKD